MNTYFYNKIKIKNGNRGQVLMVSVISFTALALIVVFGITTPIIRQVQIVRNYQTSKESYYTAEAGSEDAFYRIKNNLSTSFPEILTLNNGIATVTVATVGVGEQQILSDGNSNNIIRSVVKDITVTDGFEFNFAVQVGRGGLKMEGHSWVSGNVYSDGPINGDSTWNNYILGDAVSSGSSGSFSQVHATSTVYAHNITNSIVDRDAYYKNIIGTTVKGIKYPNSADQPAGTMPIPDSLLDTWESNATAGGVINTCPDNHGTTYTIDSDVTLGPKQINCNVVIEHSNINVTLVGAVWINGNLTINDNVNFKVSDSVGNKSVPIIAHSITNPSSKGIIDINDQPNFYGSITNGIVNPDSYVMLVSRNTSDESGGNYIAINAGNHVTGNLLLYAPHGAIVLTNGVTLREVTGYSLDLKDHAVVYYTIGLAQPLFTSGPGGKWKIKRWREFHHHD